MSTVHCTEETKFKTSSLFVCVFQIHVNLMGITGVRVLKGFYSIFELFNDTEFLRSRRSFVFN